MALQFSVAVRNARLDKIESVTGASARLKLRTGPPPAFCADADSGTVIADLTLPSDWMAAASSGTKVKSGTWQDASADASGTAGHFRLYDSTATTCHMQGTVTATGDGGDMTVGSLTFLAGQSFTVTTFSLTDANS